MIAIGMSPAGGGGGGSSASISVVVYSDAGLTTPITTANYGQTIYVNVVPSGITPTEYVFTVEGNVSADVTTQASATLTWLVNTINPTIYVSANDGSNYASGEATITVTQDALASAFITQVETNTSATVGGRQADAVNLLCWMLRGNNTTNATDLITLLSGTASVLYPCLPTDNTTASFDSYKVDLLNLAEGTYVNMIAGDIDASGVVGGAGKKFVGNVQPSDFDLNSVMVHHYVNEFQFTQSVWSGISGVHITNTLSVGLSALWDGTSTSPAVWANNSTFSYPIKRSNTGIISYGRYAETGVGAATNGLIDGTTTNSSASAISYDMCWHGLVNGTTGAVVYPTTRRMCGYAMTPWLTADQYLDFCQAWEAFNNIVIQNGRYAKVG